MDTQSFNSAIDQICEEKGISKEKVIETIEMAIAAAYKKDFGKKGQNIRAKFDLVSGRADIFQVKQVLDESMIKSEEEIAAEEEAIAKGESRPIVPRQRSSKLGNELLSSSEGEEKKVRFNAEKHIMVDEAKKEKENIAVGDELWLPLESKGDFGRIAAQTAKQVIIQRIREAEREAVFSEYKTKEGEVVSGVVQRVERGAVFIDIGKTVGILFPEEQIAGEFYRPGQRTRVLILEVQKDAKGPGIILSRTHAKMVAKLFELEVPEIASGAVEIKFIAREAGSRTKIAVTAKEEKVDPIGSCVGQKGTRVQAIINELGGEKIDIIEWSADSAKFIAHALAPAKVLNVVVDENNRMASVEVPGDQLSLAIGKRGQNVRLAAKLTGWKIDVAGAEIILKEEKIVVGEVTMAETKEETKMEKKGKKIKKEEVAEREVVEKAGVEKKEGESAEKEKKVKEKKPKKEKNKKKEE